MNYLVTGHEGFIGTNLVNYLRSVKQSVIGIDMVDYDLCIAVPGSLRDAKIDIIVHLAAETNIRNSLKDPSRFFLRNCQSTINMLEFARSKQARFIFVSSCGAPYLHSPYAASKIAGEAICEAYKQSYGLDTIILRLPSVYGPFSAHKDSVVASFIKAKLSNAPATIYGDGNQTRDFIYVEDVCESIHSASRDLQLSTGTSTSINELVSLIGCEVRYTEPIKGELTRVPCSANISPRFTLRHGLRLTMKWFEDTYKAR